MKLQKLLVIPALAAVLTLPFSAYAAKGERRKAKETDAPAFATLDKDNNESVSKAEYIAGMKDKLGVDGAKLGEEGATTLFGKLDKDNDGKLTKEEHATGQTEKKKRKKR